MLRALSAALALPFAFAAPAQAAPSLGSTFESVTSAARQLEIETARPSEWFPVRGVVDFGAYDARFGAWRGGRRHEGQDVFARPGTPLVAVREGRVVEKGDDGGRGNYVAIWSAATRRTFVYLHMRSPTRHAVGAPVEAGERVGAVGCTGSCWGDHLHFELRRGRGASGKPLNPLPLLRRLAKRAR
jgi:murein DD-endopeptidase MepM/ murein hydrolase activator NlpD